MIDIAQRRLQEADGLAAVLDAAYGAFEGMLSVIDPVQDPATTSATRSGGSPDQGCCSAGMASSGCPGSDGARARALRPSAADAAAITNAANRPLAGS